MQICKQVIDIVEIVVTMIIQVVRQIVETVCGWVTTLVTTIVEVAKKVCKWLPWPVNKLCKWVTKTLEIVVEVVEWVCEEVVVGIIIEFIERTFVYLFWVLHWVCWVISWPLRLIDLLLCYLGSKRWRQIEVCIKILTDDEGTPATTRERVIEILRRAEEHLRQCSIMICIRSIEFVQNADLMNGVSCGGSQFFSPAFSWFEKEACKGSPKPLTLYFVDSMKGANACTIANTSYVVLTDGVNGASVVHEIGHHATLGHRDDPQNIMFATASETKSQLTKWQCCMIRSSAFVRHVERCGRIPSLRARIATIHQSYLDAEKETSVSDTRKDVIDA